MSDGNGGERETLAPVIPLFGGRASSAGEPDADVTEAAPGRNSATDSAADSASPDSAWHPTWASDRPARIADDTDDSDDTDGPSRVDLAEKALLKKLRTRSLSVSEARGVLREHELDAASSEIVLASMEEYGYLDDAALAEQLIHAGVDRKGQGRQVIAQTLAKRGIPRDVADVALAALPDDDYERALEFARTKARSLRSLDRDTALRRLTGQLARRGYGGSLAMSAARAALDESPGASSGVRFR